MTVSMLGEPSGFEDLASYAMHYLEIRLGYQHISDERLMRWIDGQHAVIIDLVGSPNIDWNAPEANAPAFVAPAALSIGVVRRDIADLEAVLANRPITDDSRYEPTIREFDAAPFLGRPSDLPTDSAAEMVSYLERWIVELEQAVDLSWLEQRLAAKDVLFSGPRAELNRALSGHATAEDQTVLRRIFSTFDEWAKAHPIGLRH